MASDIIPINFLCESNICYINIPDANTQESIDRILAIQYSYSIRAVSTTVEPPRHKRKVGGAGGACPPRYCGFLTKLSAYAPRSGQSRPNSVRISEFHLVSHAKPVKRTKFLLSEIRTLGRHVYEYHASFYR